MLERGRRKVKTGEVTSNKTDKTVTVLDASYAAHPFYNKVIKKRTKLYAHDEANKCQIGDKVKLMETRPLSRLKRWRVVEVLDKEDKNPQISQISTD
ncbi:30S ribosomal protein S17 [bacterium]|nr:30S ribosomal protein S17 [bacterium]